MTRNRIMGLVGMGIGVALTGWTFIPGFYGFSALSAAQIAALAASALFFLVGLYYLIKG